VVAHKPIIAKVVRNGDMHNPTKYGAKIRKFSFSKAKCPKPMLIFLEVISTSFEVARFFEGFVMKMPVDDVSYFC
jgi:hypothetical protein